MNLTEIYSKLPINIANVLDRCLEEGGLPVNPSEEQVRQAAVEAVEKTKLQLGSIDLEYEVLLDQLPQATVECLFAASSTQENDQ